jgi:O-antigen/teichoic acid export membrane protein
MSRLNFYARALASGYLLLAANVAYTLGSVPLALHYLSKEEFGLWALTTQLAGYIALLDLGMGGASMRVLIDFKDREEGTEYGSTILTGFLVNLAQGGLIAVCGLALAGALGAWLQVPSDLSARFFWLMLGQATLTGGSLALRMAYMIMAAHQRYDIANLFQAALFGVSFALLWWGFHAGAGVFSMLWAAAVSQLLGPVLAVVVCVRLGLLPRRNRWGRPSWARFRELFVFGRDMLLYSLGSQLINASQTILLTRMADLQTAAVWSICTRGFTLLGQVVFRVFDSACAALAEMIVRDEKPRLLLRFRSVVVLSGSVSVVAGLGLAACNQPFVEWWTGGRIHWPLWNDWLLGLWLPLVALVRCHTGLVGLTKEFRFLRYLFFVEGFFFVSAALLALRLGGGVTAMLAVSIVGTMLFSFPYSVSRTSGYFVVSRKDVAWVWMQPTWRLVMMLIPVAALTAWLTVSLNPFLRLFVSAGVVGGVGGSLFLRLGLDASTRRELSARLPGKLNWLRRMMEGPLKHEAKGEFAEGRGSGGGPA